MYSAHLRIPFATEREANIVYNVLRVDEEPPRSFVRKQIHVEKKSLAVGLSAPEPRQLRVAVTSLFDHLILVVETLKQFGPPVTEQYSHYDDK